MARPRIAAINRGILYPKSYRDKLLKYWGNSIIGYYPLDENRGTAIYDVSGNGRHGVIGGSNPPVAGAAAGIGDGNRAISCGGTAESYINLNSTSMTAAFNPLEGTLLMWLGGITTTVWNNSSYDSPFCAYVDNSNYLQIYKGGGPYRQYIVKYMAGGTNKYRRIPIYNPNWFRFAITWSKSNDRVRAYINGKQYEADLTALGTWAGTISANHPVLGADFVSSGDPLSGKMAHAILLSREASADEIDKEYKLFKTPLIIGAFGDSIIAYTSTVSFSWMLRDQYYNGNCQIINHGYTGQTIISHLAAQVSAAATDNAQLIIIHMGTNDNDAGDMGVLQAEVEEQLAILKSTNPRAGIYYMNVLPRWQDNTTGPEVSKGNIRAAIAAACAAQSVTCWDTYSTPWIAQTTDTLDGLHPNDSGHAKILTEILSRLP